MDKKYEFTGETFEDCGVTYHRIRALRDFGKVRAGDLGGMIEREENLSQIGESWVDVGSTVCENAIVHGDAFVGDGSEISERAEVFDRAVVLCSRIFENAKVYGRALIAEDTLVYGSAKIYDDAKILTHGSIGDDVEIFENAKIGGNYGVAIIGGKIKIAGNTEISDDIEVYGDGEICGDTIIRGAYCGLSKVDVVGTIKDARIIFSDEG